MFLIRRYGNSDNTAKVDVFVHRLGTVKGIRGGPGRDRKMSLHLVTSNIQGLFKGDQNRLIYNY